MKLLTIKSNRNFGEKCQNYRLKASDIKLVIYWKLNSMMATMKIMTEEINVPIEWQENENPQQAGLYFIAVRYQHGFGSYDVAEWDGKEWDLGYSATVVGWVTMNDFLNVVKAGWPKHDDEVFYKPLEEKLKNRKKSSTQGDDDDFVEV